MDIILIIGAVFCFLCIFSIIYFLGYHHGCVRTFKITDDYINELEKVYNEKEKVYREVIRDIDDLK